MTVKPKAALYARRVGMTVDHVGKQNSRRVQLSKLLYALQMWESVPDATLS